jgi:hypothetical protein
MKKVTFTTVDGHKKQGLADQGHKSHGHEVSVSDGWSLAFRKLAAANFCRLSGW